MEGRARKLQLPQQQKLQPQPPPAKQQEREVQLQLGRKIPVVYYLCRNRHLEHPHFIEVPISSPDGLHLRDVINRLNVMRGKGMAALYSWSCKRSYKNGFVWHDLSEDDLILPANENEYVLKGSELMDSSPPDRFHTPAAVASSKNGNGNAKQLQLLESQPASSRSKETSPCSPGIAIREPKQPQLLPPQSPTHAALLLPGNPHEDELSPSMRVPSSSSDNVSPASSKRNSSRGSDGSHSPNLVGYRVFQPSRAVDASTQTEERARGRETCVRGVSTDDFTMTSDLDEIHKIAGEEFALPSTSSNKSALAGKMDTLESLIRAEAQKINSFRILEEEDVLVPVGPKLKATNVLMQLITCGSISVKDHHSFGFVHTYRPRFSHVDFPSPMFGGGSMVVGDIDYFHENPRLMGLRLEDKEYFSGSIIETKELEKAAEAGIGPSLKRSSSYNADRTRKSPEPTADEEEQAVNSSRLKCLPRAIRIASSKMLKIDSMRSPNSEAPRTSSEGPETASLCTSKGNSKRFTDTSSVKGLSTRLESFTEDKDRVIRIEERLTSGARVIIQSRATRDDSEGSSSS